MFFFVIIDNCILKIKLYNAFLKKQFYALQVQVLAGVIKVDDFKFGC